MFAGLANAIDKHSKAIILVWIVVLIASLGFAIKSGDNLIYDITQMGGLEAESATGSEIMSEYFDNTLDLSDIVVVEYSDESELMSAQALYVSFSAMMAEKYGDKLSVSSYGTYSKSGDGSGIYLMAISVNEEGFDVSYETGNIRDILDDAKEASGADNQTYVTGSEAISYDTRESSLEDVSKVDPLSVALIFVLLGLFFYALVTALVPPAVVGMAYSIVLMGLYFIACVLDVFYITQILILVSMLGAGCDYAIFIITRYRDECKKGRTHQEALHEAVVWGGEAVFTSGISVIIGFAALSLCTFSLVQTMGIVLALGIAVALVAALTLIPALINLAKDRIFWPSNIEKYRREEDAVVNGNGKKGFHGHLSSFSRKYFGWLSRVTEKRAAAIAVVLVLVAVPTVYAYTLSDDSADMISVMPPSESVDGLNAIMDQADGGMIMPTYVVLDLGYSIGTVGTVPLGEQNIPFVIWNDKGLSISSAGVSGAVPAIMQVSSSISEKHPDMVGTISGVNSWKVLYMTAAQKLGTDDPTIINPALVSQMPSAVQPYFNMLFSMLTYGVTPDTVIPGTEAMGGLTVANVIDGVLNVGTGILNGTASYVSMMVITTDEPMSDSTLDFVAELRDDFHGEQGYDALGIWTASYITGTAALLYDISGDVESQFSMIRIVVAVLLMVLLLLILGSYLTPIRSVLTIMFSVVATVVLTRLVFADLLSTPVLFLIPIVLFVVLLGLGMDYEIFLTTKIRENRSKGMDNHQAISQAIREAGPVISLCSLLMGGTFLTLVLAGSSMLREFGFALGMGILIDGLVMVGFVSPALMHLMGDWSWKGPGFLTRRHGMNSDGSLAEKPEEDSA